MEVRRTSIAEAIAEMVKDLPEHEQKRVLDFVDQRCRESCPRPPRRSMMGAFAHLGVDVSRLKEDIDELRKEMWDDARLAEWDERQKGD